MAFCSSCGAQLAHNEHFCVKCGADQTAKAGDAAAAVAAPAPIAASAPVAVAVPVAAQAQPVQQFAGMPQPPISPAIPQAMPPQYPQYPAGPVPIAGMPPAAPAKGRGLVWGIVLVAAAGGGYYYYTHNQQSQTQPSQTQPSQTQPGPQGQGGNNQALAQQQQFTFQASNQNGVVEITQAQWTNGSNVTIQSATLQCGQVDANNNVIQASIFQTMLNGPLGPGQSTTFQSFQIGPLQQGANDARCVIAAVTPATQ